MFRRLPVWLVLLLLLLGALAALMFGALVLHAARGGTRFKPVQDVAVAIAETPFVARAALRSNDGFIAPPGKDSLPPGFWDNPADPLVDTGYVLVPVFDGERELPYVVLLRLSDGAVVREYWLDKAGLDRTADRAWRPTFDDRAVPFHIIHPDLTPDGGLLFNGRSLLVRTDGCGQTLWTAAGFHHSIERDGDGRIWAPAVLPLPPRADVRPSFRDDTIVRLTPDGRKELEVPSSEIFRRNGLHHLVVGRPYTDDPYHLNDIEPVLADGPHWKKGDVFLSFRHQSLVMLYRPSSGKVLWAKAGPWRAQHDVTILDDHRIGVFDNQVVIGFADEQVAGHNREIVYDFASRKVSSPFDGGFEKHGLATVVGGRGTPLANGDLVVEDTNAGRLVRMNAQGDVRWRYIHGDEKGTRFRLAWARYLDPKIYAGAIEAAMETRCR